MSLYDDWCDCVQQVDKPKRYYCYTEKPDGRAAILPGLGKLVRSHYDRLSRIEDDIAELGYPGASKILAERLPTRAKPRSGDLGEILASELAEEVLGFRVPVRRMRYKDGREVAMRGDDFIGTRFDDAGGLWLLKGELKSREVLGKTAITEARAALNRNSGRCTPDSLLSIADRLLESDDPDELAFGRRIRNEVGLDSLKPDRIEHILYTLSGNAPPAAQKEDLDAAPASRNQHSVNFRIEDHPDFIALAYAEALNLGGH